MRADRGPVAETEVGTVVNGRGGASFTMRCFGAEMGSSWTLGEASTVLSFPLLFLPLRDRSGVKAVASGVLGRAVWRGVSLTLFELSSTPGESDLRFVLVMDGDGSTGVASVSGLEVPVNRW